MNQTQSAQAAPDYSQVDPAFWARPAGRSMKDLLEDEPAEETTPSDAETLLGLYHETAADVKDAVFVMTCITPAKKKGATQAAPIIQQFRIGDVKGMAAEARNRGTHSNVYFGPALMRRGLARGKRGEEADIAAVLAIVLEEDADTGKKVTPPVGVDPSFVVMSSSKPKINRHFHFVLNKPLPPSEAKELAELAFRKCGGDHGGKDITHIWRVPETLNFPGWQKIERGRPEEPQPVEMLEDAIGGTGKPVSVEVLRAALESMPHLHPEAKASGGEQSRGGTKDWSSGGSTDRDEILKRIPFTLLDDINEEGQDRSVHCFAVMMQLFDAKLTDDEVLLVATGAPFARKFDKRGDLEADIRRARAKWTDTPKLPFGYRYNGNSIEKMIKVKDKDGNEETIWVFFCSAVEFRAVTRNPEGKDWGLALGIRTQDGKWNSLTVTQAMTVDYKGFFAALYDHGLVIPPGNKGEFMDLLVSATRITTKRMCCVPHVGWHELADGSTFFALPDQTFGAPAGEDIVYQPQWNERPLYRLKGTLEGWQNDVARYAVGNSRLAFALAAGFAGPLLYLMNEEGGGVHFHGLSSRGKTRLLKAGVSIWTGGGINGGIGSWRGTDNGTEGKAWAHNDTLMTLDEIGQVKPEVAYQAAYMLSNGQGKARMSANAVLKRSYEWRVFFLSTGEMPIGDKIAENGGKPMAGQAVRVLDIPGDAGAGMGVFEELHGFENPAQMADAFKGVKNYGHAARAFLQRLAADPADARQRVENYIRAFEEENRPAGADGQVRRVLRRFALIAAAGQLAADFGVVPWPEGESARAAKKCFEAWLTGRGSAGPLETMNALSHIRSVIELHGATRFQVCGSLLTPAGGYVNNRLGYVDEGDANLFYFSLETFKKEVCKGFDYKQVLKALRAVGALDHEAGRYTKKARLEGTKGSQRFYAVKADVLMGIEDE